MDPSRVDHRDSNLIKLILNLLMNKLRLKIQIIGLIGIMIINLSLVPLVRAEKEEGDCPLHPEMQTVLDKISATFSFIQNKTKNNQCKEGINKHWHKEFGGFFTRFTTFANFRDTWDDLWLRWNYPAKEERDTLKTYLVETVELIKQMYQTCNDEIDLPKETLGSEVMAADDLTKETVRGYIEQFYTYLKNTLDGVIAIKKGNAEKVKPNQPQSFFKGLDLLTVIQPIIDYDKSMASKFSCKADYEKQIKQKWQKLVDNWGKLKNLVGKTVKNTIRNVKGTKQKIKAGVVQLTPNPDEETGGLKKKFFIWEIDFEIPGLRPKRKNDWKKTEEEKQKEQAQKTASRYTFYDISKEMEQAEELYQQVNQGIQSTQHYYDLYNDLSAYHLYNFAYRIGSTTGFLEEKAIPNNIDKETKKQYRPSVLTFLKGGKDAENNSLLGINNSLQKICYIQGGLSCLALKGLTWSHTKIDDFLNYLK